MEGAKDSPPPRALPRILSTASSFIVSGSFIAEKSPLLIEIGSEFSRFGFAGEAFPRKCIFTDLHLHNGKKAGDYEINVLIYQLSLEFDREDCRYPDSEWQMAIELFLNRIYFE